MAQEIIAFTWCDRHMRRDEKVEGQTVTLSLNAGAPRQIDLCKACYDEVVEPLAVLLEEESRPAQLDAKARDRLRAQEKRASDTQHACLVEGCDYEAKARSSHRDHAVQVHGKPLSEIESEYGHSIEGRPLRHRCPDCSLRFSTGQALGQHRRHNHEDEPALAV